MGIYRSMRIPLFLVSCGVLYAQGTHKIAHHTTQESTHEGTHRGTNNTQGHKQWGIELRGTLKETPEGCQAVAGVENVINCVNKTSVLIDICVQWLPKDVPLGV